MIKFSLLLSKLINSKKLLKALNKNIYNEINYSKNKVMIIDDNLDFNFLNNLFNSCSFSFQAFKIDSYDDLDEFILNTADNYGNINKDFLFFKVSAKNIKKFGSIIKPNYILINESSELLDELEVKEVFDEALLIFSDKYDLRGLKYSISNKNADIYITNIDYIKENITINDTYVINVNQTNPLYLDEVLMFFTFLKEINEDVEIFNRINNKLFTWEDKKIYIDISKNNFNDTIKFISRYTDYKVVVIGWKNAYEDISWLYNAEFERFINKNIQKIYCIGPNAFDIATRIKYADLNEKIIIPSSNIDVILEEIKSYNLNLYILTDEYYKNIIKGVKE